MYGGITRCAWGAALRSRDKILCSDWAACIILIMLLSSLSSSNRTHPKPSHKPTFPVVSPLLQ